MRDQPRYQVCCHQLCPLLSMSINQSINTAMSTTSKHVRIESIERAWSIDVFKMQILYSFGTGQQCQSNAGTCLSGIHASQSDSLPLQQWRGSSEQRCAHPKGCRWLLCCLQVLQRKQGVVLLDHFWQPKLFRPPLCLNHKSGHVISMLQDVQSATVRLA